MTFVVWTDSHIDTLWVILSVCIHGKVMQLQPGWGRPLTVAVGPCICACILRSYMKNSATKVTKYEMYD
jgi:hypothetical protein